MERTISEFVARAEALKARSSLPGTRMDLLISDAVGLVADMVLLQISFYVGQGGFSSIAEADAAFDAVWDDTVRPKGEPGHGA